MVLKERLSCMTTVDLMQMAPGSTQLFFRLENVPLSFEDMMFLHDNLDIVEDTDADKSDIAHLLARPPKRLLAGAATAAKGLCGSCALLKLPWTRQADLHSDPEAQRASQLSAPSTFSVLSRLRNCSDCACAASTSCH